MNDFILMILFEYQSKYGQTGILSECGLELIAVAIKRTKVQNKMILFARNLIFENQNQSSVHCFEY